MQHHRPVLLTSTLAAGLVSALALCSIGPRDPMTTTEAAAAPLAPVVGIASQVETVPVASSGDAADDPANWVHPTNPRLSTVIGNDKGGALEVYDLSGARLQRIAAGGAFFGNVDVRGNLVAVGGNGIRVFSVNPSTRVLVPATELATGIKTSGEGLCLYDPGSVGVGGGLYAFTITRDKGRVREYALTDEDGDGKLTGEIVRDFTLGSEAEGCVANDATGDLFISEEDVAVWRYGAGPAAGTSRTRVAAVGGVLPADAEGLALAGGLLLVSAQNVAAPLQNVISVYRSSAPYGHVGRVRVVAGASSDDCDRTDGIAAYTGNLGPAFPDGLLVCQDGSNDAPGTNGRQNFKFASLEPVLALAD